VLNEAEIPVDVALDQRVCGVCVAPEQSGEFVIGDAGVWNCALLIVAENEVLPQAQLWANPRRSSTRRATWSTALRVTSPSRASKAMS
jgi:hypothetical protein